MSTVQNNQLDNCNSLEPRHYSNIDMNRLTIYSIWYLRERGIENTFENIVVCCFRLFPLKFCLKGFPNYPDAVKILRALMQLRPKYRNWAIKNQKGGYELNENGEAVLKQTVILLNQEVTASQTTLDPIVNEDIDLIVNSEVYKKYLDSKEDEIQIFQLFKLLKYSSHTPQQDIEKRLKDLKRIAENKNNKQLENFINFVRRKML